MSASREHGFGHWPIPHVVWMRIHSCKQIISSRIKYWKLCHGGKGTNVMIELTFQIRPLKKKKKNTKVTKRNTKIAVYGFHY